MRTQLFLRLIVEMTPAAMSIPTIVLAFAHSLLFMSIIAPRESQFLGREVSSDFTAWAPPLSFSSYLRNR